MEHALKQVAENRADFGWVKRALFFYYHLEMLTKVCYRLFNKTLKIHINLWKMASDDPFKNEVYDKTSGSDM